MVSATHVATIQLPNSKLHSIDSVGGRNADIPLISDGFTFLYADCAVTRNREICSKLAISFPLEKLLPTVYVADIVGHIFYLHNHLCQSNLHLPKSQHRHRITTQTVLSSWTNRNGLNFSI